MSEFIKKYLMPIIYIFISFTHFIYIELICSDIPVSLSFQSLISTLKLQIFIFIILFIIVIFTHLTKLNLILYFLSVSPYFFNLLLGSQEKYNLIYEGYRNAIILDFFSAFLSFVLIINIYVIYKIKGIKN